VRATGRVFKLSNSEVIKNVVGRRSDEEEVKREAGV
jgi:hypothetical protein